MSASVELQTAIYQRLIAFPVVSAICGARVYDNPPADEVRVYPDITFGPTQVLEDDAECIEGRVEVIQIDCWARDGGRLRPAKALADAVKAALHHREVDLATQALAEMRVDLMRVFLDPDGLTAHGVVQVRCEIEER